MYNHRILSAGLRENLSSVIDGSSTRDQLNRLVSVFHALASAFLASKSTCGMLSNVTGLNTSDLAYDCIAELFQQNENGDYIQLVSYFSGIQMSSALEEEILAHTRRLVFSKVNHGVYRIYSQTDPALAKILRNVKLAVYSLKNFTETERFGEQCLMPVLCDSLEYLPPFQREELEQLFIPMTCGSEVVPELLAKLSLVLREQCDRCRIVPIIYVGLLFRSVYETKRDLKGDTVQIEDATIVRDTEEVIDRVCSELKSQMLKKYLNKKEISEKVFEKYFQVMEEGLTEKYIGSNGNDFSLYENLKKYLPDLTRDEYKNTHRNTIEYLWKLAQKETADRLKE
jgi:hypothetical protein